MADVKRYTEQIAAAKKGKDVRANIVAAINEVSDENNQYNQVKADILAAQKAINTDVTKNQQTQQAFNADLQEAKTVQSGLTDKTEAGNTLLTNLTKKVSDGNTLLTNLTKKVTEGNTTHKSLEADITAAGQAEASLEADITAAGQVEESLEADITAAVQAERSLEADITAAGQAERSLEADVTAAGQVEESLEADISTANARISTMQNLVQTADQIKTGLEGNLQQAQQASENLVTNTAASVSEIQSAGQTQIDAIKEAGGGVENALSNYFALRRNGKVFTTKIYKYATSTSPVGVKMNANENMVCEPSVGRTEGRDDYAQYGLFQHFTCNFSVDENGFNHVDALEGQTGFTKYGKVQVGEVTMSAWFGIEDTADAVLYHYSDSQTELTPHPMKESINPDGTLSPFMIHAKYVAGDIGGAPYSSKGLAPANGCQATEAKNPVSYTGMITYMHKLGGRYCGTTSWDLFYRQLMMIIKYATTHSQSIMAGCTSYNYQHMNLVEETGVSRVIVTTAQAANYLVGSYVSIGDMGEATNKDRYYAYMHNLAYSVKILSIEAVDDTNSAIYVDAPEVFDTTLTTCISTMPWHTGSTDEVAGSDGSLVSNTNGKFAYKIQGIETGIGAYEVLANVVMDIVTGEDGNPARDVYVCQDASTLSSTIATVRTSYKKAIAQVPYTAANWKYITEETTDIDLGLMIPTGVGGGSTTGFADGLYTDTGTSGQREWLALGYLSYGGHAGLWFLNAAFGWSSAHWTIVSGVSPNGTRGEWQAVA
nr:MAG TPA: chromosome segregation protein [Caudoviricetes sp.]